METLACAKILSSHGIHGELKVKSLSGEIDHFFRLKEVYINLEGELKKFEVEGIRQANKLLLVRLRSIDNPEAAKELGGMYLLAPRSASCPVEDGEFYCTDLIDSKVLNEREEVGMVRSVIDICGRSMLEIEKKAGAVTIIPFMKRFIRKVDIASHTIILSGEADIF